MRLPFGIRFRGASARQELRASLATAGRLGSWPKVLGATVVPVLLLCLWQFAAVQVGKPYLFPTVTSVADQLCHPFRCHYNSGTLFGHACVSILRVFLGFTLAAFVGVTFGLLMGSVRTVRGLVEPVLEILRPLCPIAWLPFAIAVFGLTTVPQLFGARYTRTVLDQLELGTIFVLFWGGLFPILINTLDGVAGVQRNYVSLARALGASPLQCFLHVNLPAAMPMILTGLRQGIGVCWFVIIAAEMLPGSSSGIGYFLLYAADQSDMDNVVAAMFIIGCVGALFSFIMTSAMRAFVRWHGKGA